MLREIPPVAAAGAAAAPFPLPLPHHLHHSRPHLFLPHPKRRMTEKHLPRRASVVAVAAAAAAAATASTCSIGDLSEELIALIFEHLRGIDLASVFTARLVCYSFNRIALPVAYRTVTLNKRLVAADAPARFPGALAHIEAYTRHVVASNQLAAEGVRRILESIRLLDSLTWRFDTRDFQAGSLWLPADVLSARHTRGTTGRPKLYIEDMPLRDGGFGGGHGTENHYLRSVPADLLVSLTMSRDVPLGTTSLAALKELLLSSRRLTAFSYRGWGQGTQFAFSSPADDGRRLPPLTALTLRHYNWQHTRRDVARHWDLSRLADLQLLSVPLFNFLSSVSPAALAGLRVLRAEDYSAHLPGGTGRRREATRRLHALVAHHVPAAQLEVLDVRCHTRLFPLDAVLRHAPALRELALRDHVGFGEDAGGVGGDGDDGSGRCPTLRAAEVALLARELRSLRRLELDLDVAVCDDAGGFLRGLAGGFARLRWLTLHVQTVVDPEEAAAAAEGEDADYAQAVRMFSVLVQTRRRKRLEEGKAAATASWERITINVGGWRRIMVRRLDAAWRAANARGVFAERCFVLERAVGEEVPDRGDEDGDVDAEDDDGLGGMIVREELAEERL